jgi:hypothetical protein
VGPERRRGNWFCNLCHHALEAVDVGASLRGRPFLDDLDCCELGTHSIVCSK